MSSAAVTWPITPRRRPGLVSLGRDVAYCHCMDAFWSVVSAAAGVIGAAATIAFGLIPLLRSRRQSAQAPDEAEGRALPASAGKDAPVVVGEIPQEPLGFQPRTDLLAELDAPSLGRTPVLVVHAVTGMRGVGKTQLAAAYARARLAEGWRLVAWVNADDTSSLQGGLAAVAAALGLDNETGDTAQAGRAVRHWLETNGDHCLLVFDNAADPQDLLPFIPVAGQAKVLITSNERSMADLGTGVAVDVFTPEEALAFLADRTGSADTEGSRLLAAEMGCLPLALAQAAAVIAAQHLDYPAYLQRLHAKQVDQLLPRISTSEYPRACGKRAAVAGDGPGRGRHGGVQRGDGASFGAVGRRGVPDAAVRRWTGRCIDWERSGGRGSCTGGG